MNHFIKKNQTIAFLIGILTSFSLEAKCPCLDKNVLQLSERETYLFTETYKLWSEIQKDQTVQLMRTFRLSPPNASYLIGLLATIAEGQEHHPDIFISPEELTISLYTHAKECITKKDTQFIKTLESTIPKTFNNQSSPLEHIDEKELSLKIQNQFLLKNQEWKINAESNTLDFSISSTEFTKLARGAAQICLTNDFRRQVFLIELCYGSCKIKLNSTALHKLSDQTIATALLIEKIFNTIMNK